MKLVPLTKQMRLFARRVINLGSGVRLLPGQELDTTPKGPGAISWRCITRLYAQRRVISESDPYFEEVMRTAGMKNNREFAKAWLESNFIPDTELEPEEVQEPREPDPGPEPVGGTEPPTVSEDTSIAEVVEAGGGWFDVVLDGQVVNEKRLRRSDADTLAAEYNQTTE